MSHARSTVLLVAAFCLFAPAMHAGLITFAATGVTQDSSTLSGNVVIDTTAGTVQSLSLAMTGTDNFTVNTIFSTGVDSAGDYAINARSGVLTVPQIQLRLPVGTLVGYSGGNICAGGCNQGDSSAEQTTLGNGGTLFSSGSLTAVPEPSTILLTLAGGLLLAARRRAFRPAAKIQSL